MTIYSWGCGPGLGLQLDKKTVLPTINDAPVLSGKHFIYASCGEQHSAAVDRLGNLYTWGRNKDGQLGFESKLPVSLPSRVTALSHENVVAVSCGASHTVVITSRGEVYTFGVILEDTDDEFNAAFSNSSYRTEKATRMVNESHARYFRGVKEESDPAEGTVTGSVGGFVRKRVFSPILIQGALGSKVVVSVSAGYCFTGLVTKDGLAYGLGFNDKGQLGLNDRCTRTSPCLVESLSRQGVFIKAVASGSQHQLFLDNSGRVFSCGLGVFGALGLGKVKDRLVPNAVEALEEVVITSISCGSHHSLFLSNLGYVFACGHQEYGQLGISDSYGRHAKFVSFPTRVDRVSDAIKIACGHLHNLAITRSGEIISWGWNIQGTLGHGDGRFRRDAEIIQSLGKGCAICVAAGERHSIAVVANDCDALSPRLSQLCGAGTFSDCSFVVEGRVFRGHRCIISSRSKLLGAMIAFTDLIGQTSVVLRMRASIFSHILHFLYTDTLSAPPHHRNELANEARKLRLPHLYELAVANLLQDGERSQFKHSLFTDMSELFDGGFPYDVTLHIGNERLYAHRAILHIQSDYFSVLLSDHFIEGTSKDIVLDTGQISPAAMRKVLRHMYTGALDEIQVEDALDVLHAASLFAIDDLKQIYELFVIDHMDSTNAPFLREMSERLYCPRLTLACTRLMNGRI